MSTPTITAAQHHLAAAFSAAMDAPAPLRDFVITVTAPGRPPLETVQRFRHAVDATIAAIETAPAGSKVDVRPLIERTEAHGYARWPLPLHEQALMEAFRGWQLAATRNGQPWEVYQAEQRAAANDRRALDLQMDAQGRAAWSAR